MADFTFSLGKPMPGDVDNLPNTLDLSKLEDGSIVYTHSMYTRQLFDVIRHVDKRVIVITHNGDWNMDDSYIIPECVDTWYAQNVDTYNPKVVSIPIGLENPWWFVAEHKKDKMLAMMKKPKQIRNLVYVNHSRFTKPRPRIAAYQWFQGWQWATCKEGVNGHEFDDYLDNLFNHHFMCCPEGNGIDTHRTWEALYMGTIPIEIRNANNRFYADLPICFVDRWEECTLSFLERELDRINKLSWNIGGKWNMDKLQMHYWKNLIYDKSKSLKKLCCTTG